MPSILARSPALPRIMLGSRSFAVSAMRAKGMGEKAKETGGKMTDKVSGAIEKGEEFIGGRPPEAPHNLTDSQTERRELGERIQDHKYGERAQKMRDIKDNAREEISRGHGGREWSEGKKGNNSDRTA